MFLWSLTTLVLNKFTIFLFVYRQLRVLKRIKNIINTYISKHCIGSIKSVHPKVSLLFQDNSDCLEIFNRICKIHRGIDCLFNLIYWGDRKEIILTSEDIITDEKMLSLERILEHAIKDAPEPVFFPNKIITLNTPAILDSMPAIQVAPLPPFITPEKGNAPDIPLQLYTPLENASKYFATEFTAVRPEVAVGSPPTTVGVIPQCKGISNNISYFNGCNVALLIVKAKWDSNTWRAINCSNLINSNGLRCSPCYNIVNNKSRIIANMTDAPVVSLPNPSNYCSTVSNLFDRGDIEALKQYLRYIYASPEVFNIANLAPIALKNDHYLVICKGGIERHSNCELYKIISRKQNNTNSSCKICCRVESHTESVTSVSSRTPFSLLTKEESTVRLREFSKQTNSTNTHLNSLKNRVDKLYELINQLEDLPEGEKFLQPEQQEERKQ